MLSCRREFVGLRTRVAGRDRILFQSPGLCVGIGMQPVVGNNTSNQSQGVMPPDLVFSEVLALS